MATPSSGVIRFSDIATVIKASSTTTVSLGEAETRSLLGVTTGAISMSSAYSKPVAGNSGNDYRAAGTYTFIIRPYQSLYIEVAGGGQGGNGGTGAGTCRQICGPWCWVDYCCNGYGGNAGGSGAGSSFAGVDAYGGTSAGAGGNNQGQAAGNGGAGGGAGNAEGCTGRAGTVGNAGGRATKTITRGAGGPGPYGTGYTVSVGGGGGGGSVGGGTGGSGWVYLAWS
jgi:hypothetical protein